MPFIPNFRRCGIYKIVLGKEEGEVEKNMMHERTGVGNYRAFNHQLILT
jgi:hypothetical protein